MLKWMIQCVVLAVGSLPPTSTSHPPDVVQVMNVPRPSPFFAGLPLLFIIVNGNRGGLVMRLMLVPQCPHQLDQKSQ